MHLSHTLKINHEPIQRAPVGSRNPTLLRRLAEYGRYSSVVERALCKRTVVGSNPTGGLLELTRCKFCPRGVIHHLANLTARVAQWIERWTSNPKVAGSSSAVGSYMCTLRASIRATNFCTYRRTKFKSHQKAR